MSQKQQLQVSLSFTADTARAKQSLQDLYNTLEKLSSMNINNAPGKILTQDIQKATHAAAQLKLSLEDAVNVNTGKLDLNKFNKSLQNSRMSLQQYQQILTSCGPAGQQAFAQLARSVVTADTSVLRLSDRVRSLGVTLANTVKWQISSSIVHGVAGVLSDAYSYAKDLNKSLNNIRIVTGYSVDQMKDFAEQANKAAKALSTTTTAYTDAALIFYQQGLKDDEVTKRTETVIKMANVTGEAAAEVSDYMTAIWNNFNKQGAQTVEYYADIMTALGAATASSTDEIAAGLEKFAAVADTVGLSYEYATAALATVTATTRQSADVVGTAFKTLFARIQDLELGKTLDDGTTLGTYSQALAKVGINIKDATGQMRDMDDILDEMGSKWKSLSKDQQTALAQSVAGVRQYTQLMALMENWDFMEENLKTVAEAEGALADQAKIYEESWAAASKRAQASLNDLYDSLLNDETFIKLTDFFASFIDSIGATIDSIGGLSGVLTILSSVLLKVFSPQIGTYLDAFGLKIQRIATGTNASLQAQKQEAAAMLEKTYLNQGGFAGGVQAVAATDMGAVNERYLADADKLGAAQKKIAESLLQQQNSLNEAVIQQGELVKGTENEYTNRKHNLRALAEQGLVDKSATAGAPKGKAVYKTTNKDVTETLRSTAEEVTGNKDAAVVGTQSKKAGGKRTVTMDESTALAVQKKLVQEYSDLTTQASAIRDVFQNVMAGFDDNSGTITETSMQLSTLTQTIETNSADSAEAAESWKQLQAAVDGKDFQFASSEISKASKSFDALEQSLKKQGKSFEQAFGKKAGKQIQQYGAQLKAAESAQKRMTSASREMSKIQADLDKNPSEKKRAQLLAQLEVHQKNLTAATKDYNTAIQGTGPNGQNLVTLFQQISVEQGNLITRSEAAKQALMAMGFSAPQLQALESACEAMNIDFAELVTHLAASRQGVEDFDTSMDQLVQNSNTAGTVIAKVGTVASQTAMGLQALSGIKDIWNNDDLSTGEKFTAILMNLGMVLPLVSSAMTGLTNIKKLFSIATAVNTAATNAEIKTQLKQIGLTTTETSVLWAKAIAWVAAHPYLAAFWAAAVAAAIAVMVVMINTTKQETEANLEAAKAAQEKAKAEKEEAQANKDLMQQYRDALATYKENGTGKEELLDIALKVAKAYEIEGAAVDALSGNYDNLTKKLNKARAEELKKLKETNTSTIQKTNKAFSDALRKGDGRLRNDGSYYGQFDNGMSNSDEKAAHKAIDQNEYKYLSKAGGEIAFEVADINDSAAMYAYYQELEKFLEDQRAIADAEGINLGSSEIYNDVLEELEQGSEQYAELKTLFEDNKELQAEISALDTIIKDATGKEKTIEDIKTLDEYNKFLEEYSKNYATAMGFTEGTEEWEEAIKYAEQYLSTVEQVKDLAVQSQAFNDLSGNKEIDKIKEYYNTLSEEDKELFWSVKIDETTSLDTVKAYMQQAQSYLDFNKLYAQVELKSKALSLWESSDFEGLKALFESGDNPFGIEWEDFIKMNAADAKAFLTGESQKENFADVFNAVADYKSSTAFTKEQAKNTAYNNWMAADTAANNMRKDAPTMIKSQQDWVKTQVGWTDDGTFRHYNFENDTSSYGYDPRTQSQQFSASAYLQKYIADNELIAGTEFADQMDVLNSFITKAENGLSNTDSVALDEWLYSEDGQKLATQMAERAQSELGTAHTAADMTSILRDIAASGGRATQNSSGTGLAAILSLMSSNSNEFINMIDLKDAEAKNAYDKYQTSLNDYENYVAEADTTTLEMQQKAEKLLIDALNNVETLKDFNAIQAQLVDVKFELDYDLLADGLMTLASNYEICANEVAVYEQALKSGDMQLLKTAEDALKASITIGEAAKIYGLDAEVLEYQAQLLAKEYGLSAELSATLAIQNERMNQGLSTLIENWEEWHAILTDTDKATLDDATAMAELADVIKDLTGVSDDWNVSAQFIIDNMDLIQKAAEKDTKAIAQLGVRLAKSQIENMTFSHAGVDNEVITQAKNRARNEWYNAKQQTGSGVYHGIYKAYSLEEYEEKAGAEAAAEAVAEAEAAWNAAKTIVTNGMDIMDKAIADGVFAIGDNLSKLTEIDPTFNADNWVTSLNQMAETTGMSVAEMQNYLNSLGLDAEVIEQTHDVTSYEPKISYKVNTNDDGSIASIEPYQDGYIEVTRQVGFATINGDVSYVGNGSIAPSTTDTSGGGSPKKLEKTKKSDMIDRYKEINDQLETTRRLMEKANREAEGLWGLKRLAKMQEARKLMEQQNKLLEQKAKLAEDYLKNGSENDKKDLTNTITSALGADAASKIDMNSLFDGEGNFIGYDEITNSLWAAVAQAENNVVDPNNVTEAEQKAIDDAKEALQTVLDAIGLYDETRQTALDAIAEYEQGILDIQQAALDELTAKLELEIAVDDSDLKKIDFALSSLDENIWDIGEKFALMFGSLNEDGTLNLGDESQLSNYMSKLNSYSTAYQELVDQYTTINPETGKTYINQAQFMEKLQELNDNLYSELGNLQELERALRSAFSDTMAAVDEELSKHTATMEHHVSVLDHFSTLMDLLGQSKNFAALKAVAEGQAKLAADTAKVSKEVFDMKQTALTSLEDQMKAAGFVDAEGNLDAYAIAYEDMSDAQKIIYDNWQAGVTAAQEAEEQMLADAETWAEALKAVLETRLSELADILNKNLSGEFGSLDQLNLAMERKNSLQEEYLTTTNKIYETDKLMRTAQQEIDKSTNSVAKRRLKQFIEETEQLQNQNKLSQHELDIQQAKYDLLLAEIALEEAQNAKSTVRLQRDAEGNFGYVYTADQNKVADAEQKLADAQNSLYNIGLEGANDYAQKYADTVQEMNDEITALTEARMNGEIASEEEFQQRKDAIIAHYYEKLQNYSHLYQVSLDTDGRVIEDAWSTQFGNMTYETEKWMGYVKDYAGQAADAFKAYNDAIAPIAEYTIGADASLAASKTAEIVTNNEKIVEAITGEDGVLDAMALQLQGVSDIIAGYVSMKDQIDKTIESAKELAEEQNKTLHNEADGDPNNDLKPGETESSGETEEPETEPTEPTNPNGSGAPKLEIGAEVQMKKDAKWYENSAGGGRSGTARNGTITIMNDNSHGYHIKGSDWGSGWVRKEDIEGYDTGGYTGDWGGSYGKLAFLHKKELILHEGDTANLLSSMEVLERILQVLDLQTFNAQTAGLLSTPGFKDTGSSTIEQHIEINAEFPNATDRFEIEEAFKSMAQLASQYTNRK